MKFLRFSRLAAYVVFPVLSAVLALPIVTSAIPAALREGRVHPLLGIIGAAFFGGILAAPGYLLAAFREDQVVSLGTAGWIWIRASLVLAFTVSVIAFGCAALAFWPLAVFSFVTALLCIELSYRSLRALRTSARQ